MFKIGDAVGHAAYVGLVFVVDDNKDGYALKWVTPRGLSSESMKGVSSWVTCELIPTFGGTMHVQHR